MPNLHMQTHSQTHNTRCDSAFDQRERSVVMWPILPPGISTNARLHEAAPGPGCYQPRTTFTSISSHLFVFAIIYLLNPKEKYPTSLTNNSLPGNYLGVKRWPELWCFDTTFGRNDLTYLEQKTGGNSSDIVAHWDLRNTLRLNLREKGQTLLLGVFENRHWVYLVKCWPIEGNLVQI